MKKIQFFLSPKMISSMARGMQIATKGGSSLAPVALGGPIVAGVVMMLIGGYKIADCIRYQTAAGQCDQVVENNASAVISGPLILLTGWGGFNTYNKKLREDEAPAILPARELVEPVNPLTFPAPTADQIVMEHENGKTQEDIAELFGISRYQVRRALKEARETPEGRLKGQNEDQNKDRNKDRGR